VRWVSRRNDLGQEPQEKSRVFVWELVCSDGLVEAFGQELQAYGQVSGVCGPEESESESCDEEDDEDEDEDAEDEEDGDDDGEGAR
jgi:hypothetical protein